jgi:sugar O-acyltransferase (sialic acid O-acetyltransferase NeuD family)
MSDSTLGVNSNDFRRLFIFGAGGFGREVAWLAEQVHGAALEVVFLVDDASYVRESVNGLEVHLIDDIHAADNDVFVVAVGDAELRRRAASLCSTQGLRPVTLIHPRVECSRFVEMGNGSIVCAGNILTTNIRLGSHVHVNLDCTIGHDVEIGSFSTLSPGVHVSGNVKIGENVFIGTGATIINGSSGMPLIIGDGAVIAAGACVTKPVEAGALVAGVPAIRKR